MNIFKNDGCMRAIMLFLLLSLVSVGFMFLWAYVAMYLWNWVVVELFGFPIITYWKMFGLMVLIQLLSYKGIQYKQTDKE